MPDSDSLKGLQLITENIIQNSSLEYNYSLQILIFLILYILFKFFTL